MFLHHFDYFHYRSNHNFYVRVEKIYVYNHHIATYLHTKFQPASFFFSYLGIQISADRQTDGQMEFKAIVSSRVNIGGGLINYIAIGTK